MLALDFINRISTGLVALKHKKKKRDHLFTSWLDIGNHAAQHKVLMVPCPLGGIRCGIQSAFMTIEPYLARGLVSCAAMLLKATIARL